MVETACHSPYLAVVATPLPGSPCLGLEVAAGRLVAIDLIADACVPCLARDEATEQTVNWLRHYFAGGQQPDTLPPLQPHGTAFQQRVWRRLRRIPSGQVMSYGELARELGSSARAVAGACRANPIPILIPCHRVVAADGPGGYMGQTGGEALAVKQWLLQHERHA